MKFQYTGKAALIGDDLSITDANAAGPATSYYVTAVDVAGKESEPSAVVGLLGGINPDGVTPPDSSGETPEDGERPGRTARTVRSPLLPLR